MCVEGGIFFKINKRDSTFIREMRVHIIEFEGIQKVFYPLMH